MLERSIFKLVFRQICTCLFILEILHFQKSFLNIAFLSVHFIHTREKPFIEDEHSILKQSDFHKLFMIQN